MDSVKNHGLILVGCLIGGISLGTIVVVFKKKSKQDKMQHPSMRLKKYGSCVYLDYNATTPIFPEVMQKMIDSMHYSFGNPSSLHCFGKASKESVEIARKHVARLINCHDEAAIVFTASGTESDNRAIDIAIDYGYRHNKNLISNPSTLPHIISCVTEHPAILLYLKKLKFQKKISLSLLSVNSIGMIDMNELQSYLSQHTVLVTIMHANNETGVIHPIKQISKIIQNYNFRSSTHVLFHTDAAQSLGKIPLDVTDIGLLDMATIVGHKMGAPKGIGALYINPAIRSGCRPMTVGGGQERETRSGTESVTYISGLGEACRIAYAERYTTPLHMRNIRNQLARDLKEGVEREKYPQDFLRFNAFHSYEDLLADGSSSSPSFPLSLSLSLSLSPPTTSLPPIRPLLSLSLSPLVLLPPLSLSLPRDPPLTPPLSLSLSLSPPVFSVLPNTLNISFRNIRVTELMPLIVDQVACSAGSACHSDSNFLSPVLSAMQVPEEYGYSTLRLSVGRHTTERECERAVTSILEGLNKIRERNKK